MPAVEEEILYELRMIRALLTVQARTAMSQKELIAALANVGIPPKEIAAALGTTSGTVSVALVGLRKSGKVKTRGGDQ